MIPCYTEMPTHNITFVDVIIGSQFSFKVSRIKHRLVLYNTQYFTMEALKKSNTALLFLNNSALQLQHEYHAMHILLLILRSLGEIGRYPPKMAVLLSPDECQHYIPPSPNGAGLVYTGSCSVVLWYLTYETSNKRITSL